jgi:chemotaxis family two-component system response regulator Rcp1
MREVKLLLVEDNRADIRLTEEALKEFKFANELHVAVDGVAALEHLKTNTPDMIILDLNLPKLSGFEVLEKLKKDVKLKLIPVVVLTTSENTDHIKRAYELGANSYLTKPIEFVKFLETIGALGNFWFMVVKLPRI